MAVRKLDSSQKDARAGVALRTDRMLVTILNATTESCKWGLRAILACALATAQTPHEGPTNTVEGARVESVTLADGKAAITVINQSSQNITGFSLGLTAQLQDGGTEYGERTEDYGPRSVTGKALRPGESATELRDYPPTVRSVEARVIVAIYEDGTAEVSRGHEKTFDDTVATRRRIAVALQRSSDALKNAVDDDHPSVRAQRDLERALRNTSDSQDSADRVALKAALDLVRNAPPHAEREFIQGQAARLDHEATANLKHAQARRLP